MSIPTSLESGSCLDSLLRGPRKLPSLHQWTLRGWAGRTLRRQRAQPPHFRVADTDPGHVCSKTPSNAEVGPNIPTIKTSKSYLECSEDDQTRHLTLSVRPGFDLGKHYIPLSISFL